MMGDLQFCTAEFARELPVDFIGPAMRTEVPDGIQAWSRFQQQNVKPAFGQLLCGSPAGRSGTDHNGVVGLLQINHQNRILTASCRMRGLPSVPVNLPKVELVIPVLGWPKLVRLDTLKASKRNWPSPDSPSGESRNPFTMERSKLAKPGPSRILRPSVPSVFGAG